MDKPHQVFIVQRATALYGNYEDRFIEILGVYANLEDANEAVRRCQEEFVAEFGISVTQEEDDDGGVDGFLWEDRGTLKQHDGKKISADEEGGKEDDAAAEVGKAGGGGRDGGDESKVGGKVKAVGGSKAFGLYWEFDNGGGWDSCFIEAWSVL